MAGIGGPQSPERERERLEFALAGTRLGLWDWDMKTGETVFNERWADIIGYTLAELQPTTIDTWLRFAHPDDLARSEEAIGAHVRGDTPAYDVDVRMIHRDGHVVWVHDRGQVMAWARDGSPQRMVGTHEDITERVQIAERLAESEERYAGLFRGHQAAMLLIDPASFTIVDANQSAADLYGYSIADLQGMALSTLDDSDPDVLRDRLTGLLDAGGARFMVENRRADGAARLLEVDTSLVTIDGARMLFSLVTDVTAREEQAARLREAAAVFDAVQEGVLISDSAGLITSVNQAFTTLTGIRADELIGQHAMGIVDPAVPDEVAAEVARQHFAGDGMRSEVPVLHADGSSSPSIITVSPILARDGSIKGYVTLVADIAEHVQAEKETLDQATTIDHVTGLSSRRGFTTALASRLSHRRRTDAGGAVLIVDLDRFKDVNDSYGAQAGDELLRGIGERLSTIAGEDDIVARIGGDEFALFALSVASGDDADRLARRVQDTLAPPITVALDLEVFVTACIGVCLTAPEAGTGDSAIQQATAALSEAKRAGAGSIRHHDESLTTVSRARLGLETRLRRAWEHGDFVVHFQPQVDVATEAIVGAEALLRWPIEGGGQVPPGSFIPLAEQIGLIDEIGAWVLDESCAQARRWHADGLPDLRMAVNVSARQLARGTFAERVGQALRGHQMPPWLLELELTESALLETGDRTLALLDGLSALGVRLSIDDFGTGYSSFAYLKRFPLDQLKVDRSFISDLESDPESRAITAAIIALGHTLGLNVLAEGVETSGQLAVLRGQACDLFQGYLLAPALPPDAFAELVRSTL